MFSFSRLFRGKNTPRPEKTLRFSRLCLEELETREVPATFTVTNLSGDQNVAGSLPAAVFAANYFSPGLDFIKFNIAGSGQKIIQLNSSLFINSQMVIDGLSQPGSDGFTPQITILGNANVSSLFILQNDPAQNTTSTGSTIQGFTLSDYGANAVTIFNGSTGNFIQNNRIGFFVDGNGAIQKTSRLSSFPAGVGIQSSFNVIRNNTISGLFNGIVMGEDIGGSFSGRSYLTNSINNNKIGTDPLGTTSFGFGNLSDGIFLGAGARENFLGPDNVLSGNASSGAELLHNTNIGNVIFASRIGTNNAGTAIIGNGELGVLIANGANGNAIGGPFGGNVFAGNTLGAIALGTSDFPTAVGNFVQFNIIGLNSAQTAILGGQGVGISLESNSSFNVIQSNVIAGSNSHGIVASNVRTNNIQGNWIGQSSGGVFFGNGGFGITLLSGASFNFVTSNLFGLNALGSTFVDPGAVGNAIS